MSSYLYNICIIIPSEQTVLIHSCKLSSVRLWQTLPCCTSCWLVSTSSARFNIQRNFISNMCSSGSVLRRSISSEVLGLEKKRLKRPGLKVISMYFCYFKLEMGESEQEDMNPERQRDVRVERRGCEVSVRRACCVCVKYLSHQQCEFSQTPRFNSKQTQLFFFFFSSACSEIKKTKSQRRWSWLSFGSICWSVPTFFCLFCVEAISVICFDPVSRRYSRSAPRSASRVPAARDEKHNKSNTNTNKKMWFNKTTKDSNRTSVCLYENVPIMCF